MKFEQRQEADIPVKRKCWIFCWIYLFQFNEAIHTSKFPASFKFASVTLNFKQGSRNQKNNYRPISILSIILKIFEKLICRQLLNHFDNILSKFQCGFRKGYNLQHCLLLMIDKWKKAVDNNKVLGALLTDLSKAFDCICHDLLAAKLNAYGLSFSALVKRNSSAYKKYKYRNLGCWYNKSTLYKRLLNWNKIFNKIKLLLEKLRSFRSILLSPFYLS